MMVAKDRQNKTESPKVEVGEIDTRAPFQSVKDALNLFGQRAFSPEKPTIKKIQPNSAERISVKETQLHVAQKELNKLREQLKNAESTKAEALVELERAKVTLQDLTNKLQTVNEAKDSAIKATETVKNQAKQLDLGEIDPINCVWKPDFENAKEQYTAIVTELDAAKQELMKIQQDREAVMEQKSAALRQANEAEVTVKANLERARELSNEITSVQKVIEQVKLVTADVEQEQSKIHAAKNTQKLSHKAALEESAKKLLALRKESNPEMSKDLETKLAETRSEIEKMQKEMGDARASDVDSLKTVTSELDDAKGSLQKVAEEENDLKQLLESLKLELENVRKEHTELSEKEAEMETIAADLHVKLQKSKSELEVACAEEAKVKGASDEMLTTLQQLSSESEKAKREAGGMKAEVEELKKEAEAMGVALEEAENKLKAALEEAEEAKAAEAKALEEIKRVSERTDAARASTSDSGSKITISRDEFESLNRKVEESKKLADMKVGAAMAHAEAVRASENEAMKRLEAAQKEIEEMKVATEAALKRAEMAEAAKKAVEGELRRWREREQKKAAETASRIVHQTQMSSLTTPSPSPPVYKQNPNAAQKTGEVKKFEKSKHTLTKKVLVSNLSGIFQRKKSQVEGGSSPSYLPGEKPM